MSAADVNHNMIHNKPDLIGKAQTFALAFCMGIQDRLGKSSCIFYRYLNADTVKVIGQLLIEDAAIDLLCEYDLDGFLKASSLCTVALRECTLREMAKIAYRLYVHDEEVPMMQAKIISSFGPSRRHSRRTTTTTQEEGEEDEEDNKYHSLVDLIWEFRASMQAACDENFTLPEGEPRRILPEFKHTIRLHDACRLYTAREIKDGCCGRCEQVMLSQDTDIGVGDYSAHLMGWVPLGRKDLFFWDKLKQVDETLEHIEDSLGKPEKMVRWMAELFILQASIFPIGTEQNKVTHIAREAFIYDEHEELNENELYGSFCGEYPVILRQCEEDNGDGYYNAEMMARGMRSFCEYKSIVMVNDEEFNGEISIEYEISEYGLIDMPKRCECKWCTTYPERKFVDSLFA